MQANPMPSLRPTPAKAPFAAGCGKATLQALSPPLLIANPMPSLRPTPANAVPSTALHLLTSTRPPEPQTNRSTAPANRSIRFTSLRVHFAQSVSAVQRKRTLIGAALRFAPFAQPTRQPSHDPHPQRLPFAAGCGRATMLALFPPLLITNPTPKTNQRRKAPHSASLRLRSQPGARAN